MCDVCDVRKLYLSKYPIFDENYRDDLNQKILDHYWTREIGQETIELWGHYLKRKMNEIMPVYNQLYRSLQMDFDPLNTIDIRTVTRGENESTSTQSQEGEGKSTGSSTARAVGMDYPQSALSGSEDYATSGNDTVGETKGSESSTGKVDALSHGKNIGDSHVTGRQGSAMSLINEFRAQIINVDMMIIEELEPMFMQIFSNGDFEPNEPYFPYMSSSMLWPLYY